MNADGTGQIGHHLRTAGKTTTPTGSRAAKPPPPTTATLTVTKAGSGKGRSRSRPAGIICGTDCSQSYTTGTVVTLTAIRAAAGSTLTGWSGACACLGGAR